MERASVAKPIMDNNNKPHPDLTNLGGVQDELDAVILHLMPFLLTNAKDMPARVSKCWGDMGDLFYRFENNSF